MNLYASYRALLGNAIAALSAAIEIYNKPRISYREECSVILLINAWELLLKAMLSKNRRRIYYPKLRNKPYRTYSIDDALKKVEPLFPSSVDYLPTAHNIRLLKRYRDNAIHFYNDSAFDTVLYSLAQTAIVNFRDVVVAVFDRDVVNEITVSLLPLSVAPPVDPIQFLAPIASKRGSSIGAKELTDSLVSMVQETENRGFDAGRLLTVFDVHLTSLKKVSSADLVVGIDGSRVGRGRMVVHKTQDPNITHPLRECDIISGRNGSGNSGLGLIIGGRPLTQHPFRALTWKYNAKENRQYCWEDKSGQVTRYSHDYISFLRRLSAEAVDVAISEHKAWMKERARQKRSGANRD